MKTPKEFADYLIREIPFNTGYKIEAAAVVARDAEVQEEYRQKVRGQITSLYGVYENNSEYGKVLGLKQALDLPALRDPEPEPSEAAMRAARRWYPASNANGTTVKELAAIIDEELRKGAAKSNA